MNSGSVLLLGGNSDIGGELAARLCAGREVHLAARRPAELEGVEKRLRQAGATAVHRHHFDATEFTSHRSLVEEVRAQGEIAVAIVAFGILGDQEHAEKDEQHALEITTVDYSAQITMLTVLADVMKTQTGHSSLVAFSSIAGWRGRRANYVYGSTKAGLDTFCQGLTDALHGTRVSVVTARPGFVIGAMTEGMKPAPMSVTPEQVAEAVAAQVRKKRSATLWIPARLQPLAWIMKLVPRPLWRNMPR
ncbi:putative oxidoreductase [Corynebacterium occultum]|uniref:Putative oxidoreductase n=1 Tax=Corynebacterium occultum TaxID=2675219 RepID=A0A6B8W4D2_9CORY|nr:SDR family oxidoreductase [Corynebacterium occultum]QGU07381.1 putative oxidoreductase [Corynebacterium occultum]